MKTYRVGKAKRNVVDKVDVEMLMGLLDKGEFLLFANIYDTLHYAIFKVGEQMSPDQMDVLMLPYKLWNRKAGFILSEMRRQID